MRDAPRLIALLALAAVAAGAGAQPYTPAHDDVVLERLPERGDPALAELKRLRARLSANPRDVAVAVDVARRSIQAARTSGDPRFAGQAEAALAPWWRDADAPPQVLLLRATIRQNRHEFAAALADLDRLLATNPAQAQALLTRATLLTVQGRYDEALRDCDALQQVARSLAGVTCATAVQSVTGHADAAYDRLTTALARARDAPPMRAWALTLAGDIAARRGDVAASERHFRELRFFHANPNVFQLISCSSTE
jgi:tetratricopeptide (TPR) repeat protein